MTEIIDDLMIRARPRADALDRERIAVEVSRGLFERRAAPLEIGRFTVEARLGAGGMGIVYRGYDPELDRRVAIKLLDLRRVSRSPERDHERLLREARALARLAHPNVVAVHDVGILEASDGEPRVYLVMEYVAGPTLRRWMEGEHTLEQRLALLLAAGHGLAAAHDSGLVHGDFKPENILVGTDGRARVADFGLALQMLAVDTAITLDGESENELGESSEALRQQPGITISKMFGTPAYIAPEQFCRRRIDARADQFAFCVVACELLYGRRPFVGNSLEALGAAAMAGKLEPIDDHRIPRKARAVIRRGLAADPSDRFSNMHELLARLEVAFAAGRPAWWSGVPTLAIVAAVAAASAGLAALVYGSEPSSPACVAAEDRLAPTWSRERAATLEARLRARDPHEPGGSAPTELLLARLDAHTRAWSRAWTDSCTRGTDDATHERMQTCLDARLLELDTVVEALTDPERELLAPLALLEQLVPVETCLDNANLDATRPVPIEASRRREVEQVRNQLIAKATLAAELARSEDALSLAREAVARSEQLEFRPLEAEAQLALARALRSAEQIDDAARMAEQAHLSAEASRHFAALADAAALRVELAYDAADLDEGRKWLTKAEAANEATGGDPHRALRLHETACMLELLAGAYEPALAECERAQALIDEGARIDATSQVRLAHNFAIAEQGAGRLDRAERRFATAEAAIHAQLGPTHPWLINLLLNWGHVAYDRGQLEQALIRYRGAEALLEPNGLEGSSQAGSVLVSLADAQRERGQLDAAELAYRRAAKIAVDIDDYWTAHTAANGLAQVALARGEVEAARDLWLAQRAEAQRRLERSHPWLLDLEINIGAARVLAGEVDQGLAQIDAALAILEYTHGAEHPELADDLWVRGHAARMAGLCRRALGDLDRARDLELARGGPGSPAVAAIEVERSACHLSLGQDPSPEIDLLEHAVEILAAGSRRGEEALARVELGRAYLLAGRESHAQIELELARQLLVDEEGDHQATLDTITTLLDRQRARTRGSGLRARP